MILLAIFITAFLIQVNKTISERRRILAFIALGVLLLISYSDLIWLVKFYQLPFHPSDPFNYYIDVRDRTLREVMQIESTNKIYFVVNWILDSSYPDSQTFVAFILKTTNVLAFITTYLLATRKRTEINIIDYLILFNPYTIMTINRNVRDIYIVLFVLMILIGIGCIKNDRINVFWTLMGVFLLWLARPILLALICVIFLYTKRRYISWWHLCVILGVVSVVLYYNINEVVMIVARQVVSAIDYIGEDVSEFRPLLEGNISFAILKTLLLRMCVGVLSFLFTPHPVNYISSWIGGMDNTGAFGIYTGFDNVLVSIGSLFNYCLVIPLLFVIFTKENIKKVNRPMFLFCILFVILYVVSYLGVTDIRNRNTAYFFMLLTLLNSDVEPKFEFRNYLYTFLIFCIIFLFSS